MSFDNYGLDENAFNHDPQGRSRFYGIYSAQVAAGLDPTDKNRIKVKVFMPSGTEVSNWAKACLPVTDSSYHPDHKPHIVADLAAMLTTVPVSVTDSRGDTETVPALTIVAKSPGNQQLNHEHVAVTKQKTVSKNNATIVANSPSATTDSKENSKYTDDSGLGVGTTVGSKGTLVPEHTFHRSVPVEGQMVWVVFEAGLLEYPVWIGVQS